MKENELAAYIVPGTDPHASEYMAPHWAEMNWLSGFTGESGTMVVTLDDARLFTDSRYYLQAETELKGSGITLMRASDVDCPSVNDFLIDRCAGRSGDSDTPLSQKDRCAERPLLLKDRFAERPLLLKDRCAERPLRCKIGVNPEMWSINQFKEMKEATGDRLQVVSIDLIRPLWTEGRPAIPQHPFYEYEEQYAGESVASKLQRVREAIQAKGANAIVISELDEIGWLLNIRGKDVDYTPCVIAYVVVDMKNCTLFIDPTKVTPQGRAYMQRIGVEMRGYTEVFDFLKDRCAERPLSLKDRPYGTERFLMDGNRVNERLYEAVGADKAVVVTPSPVQVMMSVKNDTEIAGEKEAHLVDGVALVRFLKWMNDRFADRPLRCQTAAAERPASPERLTEIDLADKLHEFRTMGKNFTDESFATIAGWKGNGAIVHYHAEPGECATIDGEGVLLLDSGGQYLEGTTDITRTLWIGNPAHIPAEVKHDYTLVLKGHIALAKARFPKGTRGNQLDVLAHQFMWAEGITYGHGTGHGVGHFMGCHEGPANIRTDNNTNPIQLGNIFSDEPGIYRANEYGIRIENLVVTKEVTGYRLQATGYKSTGETYYEFEALTRCPYDTNLIDLNMLTEDEKAWINAYHAQVYKDLAPRLNADEAAWLKEQCKAIC